MIQSKHPYVVCGFQCGQRTSHYTQSHSTKANIKPRIVYWRLLVETTLTPCLLKILSTFYVPSLSKF